MLQFIESDPADQARLLKRIFDAEVEDGMAAAVEAAKEEQHRRIITREQKTKKK